MAGFQSPEWSAVFLPDAPLLESFVRGTAVYLSLLVLFRLALTRQGGSIGFPDVMLVVLVSECVSNALGSQSNSVPNGLAAVSALLLCNYLMDRAAYRWPRLRKLLEPAPLPLVEDGRPLRENLEAEAISDDELAAALRKEGIDDVRAVASARIEADGQVSVIPKDDKPEPEGPPPGPTPPDVATAVERFAEAAEALRKAIRWHEDRATEHRAAVRAAKGLLARHGVRGQSVGRDGTG